MKRLSLVIVLAVIPFFLAYGQDSDSDSEGSLPPLDLKLSGLHEFDYRIPLYGDSFNYEGEMKKPRVRNELGLEVKEGDIKIVSRWQLDSAVDPDMAGLDQWSGSTRARNLENYIAWNPEQFKVGLGYQIYAWGVADGRNPTDNLNPRDYATLEGEKPLKIPVLSASLNWYPTEEISMEAVFVPQPQNSIFPLDYQDMLAGYGFSNVQYRDLSNTPSNSIVGGKLNYRSSAADLSVSYLYDYDAFYTPIVSLDTSNNVTGIDLTRKRIHRFGADGKATIDRFGIWAEGCYSMTGNHDTSDYSERLSRIDYTIGFDFSYGPQDDYYFNLQYTGAFIPGFDSSSNTDLGDMQVHYERMLVGLVGSETERVTQGITWNAKWNLASGAIVPKLTGAFTVPLFYDDSSKTRYGNLLLKPEIDFMPVDSFHIRTGVILAYAWVKKPGKGVGLETLVDPVGIYTPSNSFFVSVSYQWNYETTK